MKSIFELEWRHVYIWLGISLILSALFLADLFPSVRARLSDMLLPTIRPSGHIILVKIDDASLNKIGQWPWPRAVFAQFLKQLDGAAAVGIDVGFREPSHAGSVDDAAFVAALAEAPFPIILPSVADPDERGGPLPLFAIHTIEGFSDLLADSDGVVRRSMVWEVDEPSFAYAVTASAQRLEIVPLAGEEKTARIAYRGQNGSFPSMPFVDVLSGTTSQEDFAGKIILVGVTASDLQNFRPTPFGFMSGIEIQANIADSLLSGRHFRESFEATVASIVLITFLTTIVVVHVRRLFAMVLLLAVIAGAYISLSAFSIANFFALDILYPVLGVALVALVGSASQYLSALERERAIRESFTYLDSMIESMRDGIIMVDSSLNVRLANKAAQSIFRTSDKTLILRQCANALTKHIDLLTHLEESVRSRETAHVDDVLFEDRFYSVLVAPVQSSSDTRLPLGSIVLFHDTTHQKEVERIRQDFISMMVHDLRAPLDAIRKLSDALLGKDGGQENRRVPYLNMVRDNSMRMLELVNDLLDLAKIEAGKFEVAPSAVPIRRLIEGRIAFFEESAKVRGVLLKECISRDVPESVLLDENYVSRALNNALSNALKFTSSGSVTVHAFMHRGGGDVMKEGAAACSVPAHRVSRDVSQRNIENGFVLAIADTGAGIPAEKLSELFSKFTQLHKGGGGTGLGLSIVKGITEAHGGSVSIASTFGKGTVMYLVFPNT